MNKWEREDALLEKQVKAWGRVVIGAFIAGIVAGTMLGIIITLRMLGYDA